MKKLICVAAITVMALCNGGWVAAQSKGAEPAMPGIGRVTRGTFATNVSPNLYYTQLHVTTTPFAVPQDEPSRRRLGRAILEALGARRETRSIIVSMAVTTNLVNYPEYPLLVYRFDGERRLTEVDRINSTTLPLHRMDASDVFNVKLTYRYSDQATFDIGGAFNSVTQLVPGATLVSTGTKPFLDNVFGLASRIFTNASSQTQHSGLADQMSPYGVVHAKTLTFELTKPDNTPFGSITMQLLATPTLQRPAAPVAFASQTDFASRAGENPTTLALPLGGVSRNLVTEVKGLNDFGALTRLRTREAAAAFCGDARTLLNTTFALTLMDRSLVMLQAMRDVDRSLAEASWYFGCFDDQEKEALRQAIGLNPTEQVAPDPAGPIPVRLKDALGCLMTGQTGQWCSTRAPNPRQILLEAMADQVRIGQMDYAELINITGLDPTTRLLPREALLDQIAGKASSFKCYARGLLIGVADDSRAYDIQATITADRISGFQAVAISTDALQCT